MVPNARRWWVMTRLHGRRIGALRLCTWPQVASRLQFSHRGRPSMTKLLPVAVAVCAVLAGCASTPPEADPVQIKLNDLDARVARIERVVSNQSLVQLAQNLDSVQAETRRLRGRIDELENSNETMKKQLASRVSLIGGGAAAANAAAGGANGAFGAAG